MELDQLGFSCPRCDAELVVPASAAGAEGACPKCGGLIRAPKFVAAKVEEVPVRLEVKKEPEVVRAKPVAVFQPAPAMEQPQIVRAPAKGGKLFKILAGCGLVVAVVVLAAWLAKAGRAYEPEVKAAAVYSLERKGGLADEVLSAPAEEKAEANPALDPRIPPEGMDVALVITRSAEVLGKFLAVKTLVERKALMETATADSELENGVLAGALPVASTFASTEVKFNKVEGYTDVAFKVSLAGKQGLEDPHMVVVRTRGTQDPKVVAEPFLDGFGGRLEEFAKAPAKGERTFRTVMSVFDFCTDTKIPDHVAKFTAKLGGYPGGADIAKAYFGRNSPLAVRLGKAGAVSGRGIGATVVLRWTEDPQPFIEVVDVKTLSWDD